MGDPGCMSVGVVLQPRGLGTGPTLDEPWKVPELGWLQTSRKRRGGVALGPEVAKITVPTQPGCEVGRVVGGPATWPVFIWTLEAVEATQRALLEGP